MSGVIRPTALVMGDVFVSNGLVGIVDVARPFVMAEAYTVIDYHTPRGGTGRVEIKQSGLVRRLHPSTPEEVASMLHDMLEGDTITVTSIDGVIYA